MEVLHQAGGPTRGGQVLAGGDTSRARQAVAAGGPAIPGGPLAAAPSSRPGAAWVIADGLLWGGLAVVFLRPDTSFLAVAPVALPALAAGARVLGPRFWPLGKRHLAVVAVVLGLAGLVVLACDSFWRIYWVGFFDVEVRLVPKGGRRVVRVEARTLRPRELAAEVRRTIEKAHYHFSPVERFDGRSFTVRALCGGDCSVVREHSYAEEELLLLRLEYEDGGIAYEVVEIPPGCGDRSLTVEVP